MARGHTTARIGRHEGGKREEHTFNSDEDEHLPAPTERKAEPQIYIFLCWGKWLFNVALDQTTKDKQNIHALALSLPLD